MDYEKEEYKGCEIQIHQDECSESPREWDNFGTMVCFHSRYNLGDAHDFSDPIDVKEFLEDGDVYYRPLYLYDHSGLTMNTGGFSCNWDSGQVGWIYVTKEKAYQECKMGVTDEEIYKYLDGEVEVYDNHLQGQVYGYETPDFGDSCWGYYGYDHEKSGLLADAKSSIDFFLKRKQEKKHKQLKNWINHNVPFQYRTLNLKGEMI